MKQEGVEQPKPQIVLDNNKLGKIRFEIFDYFQLTFTVNGELMKIKSFNWEKTENEDTKITICL